MSNRHERRKANKMNPKVAPAAPAATNGTPRPLEGMQREAADAIFREIQDLQAQHSDLWIGMNQITSAIIERKKRLQEMVVAALRGQGFDPQKVAFHYDPLTGQFRVRPQPVLAMPDLETQAPTE